MASHRRASHPESRRVKALFARLEALLRQASPDRLEAFAQYLKNQVQAEKRTQARTQARRSATGPISEVVQRAVRESGLSVHALARVSGVPQPVLSRFIRRERDITLSTLEKLAGALRLELRRKKDGKRR